MMIAVFIAKEDSLRDVDVRGIISLPEEDTLHSRFLKMWPSLNACRCKRMANSCLLSVSDGRQSFLQLQPQRSLWKRFSSLSNFCISSFESPINRGAAYSKIERMMAK